jgi:ABC-type branched-subunit amino acid transport system substrate-binding protein
LPEWYGTSFAAKQAGAKTIAYVTIQFPGSSTNQGYEEVAANKLGVKPVGVVSTTLTQVTFDSTIQQLRALNPDAVMLNTSSQQADGIVEAAASVGFDPIWISAAGSFTPQTFSVWAKLSTKEWLASSVPPAYDTAIPGIATFNREMNADAAAGDANAATGNRDENSIYTWLSVHAFTQLAKLIKGPVTNTSILAEMKKAKNINVEGIFTWSPSKRGLATYPRVTDGGLAYFGPVSNGLYVPAKRLPVLMLSGVK